MEHTNPSIFNNLETCFQSSDLTKQTIEKILVVGKLETVNNYRVPHDEQAAVKNLLNCAVNEMAIRSNTDKQEIVKYINYKIFKAVENGKFPDKLEAITQKIKTLFPILKEETFPKGGSHVAQLSTKEAQTRPGSPIRDYFESPVIFKLMQPLDIQKLIDERGEAWAQKVKEQLNTEIERLTPEIVLERATKYNPINRELIQLICAAGPDSPAMKAFISHPDFLHQDFFHEILDFQHVDADINIINSLLKAGNDSFIQAALDKAINSIGPCSLVRSKSHIWQAPEIEKPSEAAKRSTACSPRF